MLLLLYTLSSCQALKDGVFNVSEGAGSPSESLLPQNDSGGNNPQEAITSQTEAGNVSGDEMQQLTDSLGEAFRALVGKQMLGNVDQSSAVTAQGAAEQAAAAERAGADKKAADTKAAADAQKAAGGKHQGA